ncbi:MAG: hypothetical protein L0Y38_07215 [Methylococcaceae bacterium]|nr:hypothetical protein [Methylococcaceae bacterium]MCI0667027.1 hypothetical protein [Methylococcaceae bacterium]MCI0733595.1 hypothetical protein [Methylococcaceae bacterium]
MKKTIKRFQRTAAWLQSASGRVELYQLDQHALSQQQSPGYRWEDSVQEDLYTDGGMLCNT